MASFSLSEIKSITNGKTINIENELEFLNITTDTRKISEGDLYLALKGERFDGHEFVEDAIAKGALAAIVEKEVSSNVPQIVVADTLKALQLLANANRRRFDIPVVGITGSSGKTTTKELIATVLDAKFKVLKTEKNYNNEIGVPLTLLELDDTHEACVIEMGMRGLGQIKDLAEIAEPTIGVITNVGTSHVELLGSQEGVAKAKGELVEAIPEDGYVVLNEDDKYVRDMADNTKAKIMTYGIKQNAMTTGFNLRYKVDGIKFNCRCYDAVFSVFLPMIGDHNVINALAAIAVGRVLGVSTTAMSKALGNFAGISQRQEIIRIGDFVVVNDTYNANPSSMRESIKAIGQLDGKRKIAILGDMLELGEESPQYHREIGALLAQEKYDLVLLYGDESKYIGEEAKKHGISEVFHFDNHEKIAEFYLDRSQKNDSILLKGSRGMTMEKVAEILAKMVK